MHHAVLIEICKNEKFNGKHENDRVIVSFIKATTQKYMYLFMKKTVP